MPLFIISIKLILFIKDNSFKHKKIEEYYFDSYIIEESSDFIYTYINSYIFSNYDSDIHIF